MTLRYIGTRSVLNVFAIRSVWSHGNLELFSVIQGPLHFLLLQLNENTNDTHIVVTISLCPKRLCGHSMIVLQE